MHLPSLLVFLLASSTIPTEAVFQLDLSSALSSLFHVGNNKTSLSRQKRAAAQEFEYSVDFEVSFQDPSLQSAIKYLIGNLTYPINLNDSTTSIQRINVTTACNQVGQILQCRCEDGFIWAASICKKYPPCSALTKDSCNCININITSNSGLYCKAMDAVIVKKSFSLRIDKEYTAQLSDPTTTEYQQLKNILEEQLFDSFHTLPGFEFAEVKSFRKGSVMADYVIATEPVTDSTIQDANNRFTETLNKTLPLVFPAVTHVITENITVSKTFPATDVFFGDTVNLSCTVSISTYISVKWYLNGNLVDNASYTVSVANGNVTSILPLPNVTDSKVGTYLCVVDQNTDSYHAEYNLTAEIITMKILNTDVACNNTNVSVIQCCPSGAKDLLQLTCQNTSGNYNTLKSTYLDPGSLCRVLKISATLSECNGGPSTDYSCTCTSNHGAKTIEMVTVNYMQPTLQISGKSDISQGDPIELVCGTGASMTWAFQKSDSSSQPTAVLGSSYSENNGNSTLIISGSTTNLGWDGTFFCYSGNRKAEKRITVTSLVPPDQISIEPVTFFYLCGTKTKFECCVQNYEDHYTQANLITPSSSETMTKDGRCFSVQYTFNDPCSPSFETRCQIFNRLNNSTNSKNMSGTKIPESDLSCTDPPGKQGSNITVSCNDSSKIGTVIKTCDNKAWKIVESNCVSLALSRLSVSLEELSSPGSEIKIPGILASISSTVANESNSITNSAADITKVVDLLTRVDQIAQTVDNDTMANFLRTVDVVVGISAVDTWRTLSNESDRLLSSVDTFASKLNFSEKTVITHTNLQLFGIIANGSVGDFKEDFSFNNNLASSVLISDLRTIQANTSVVSIAYATLNSILPTTSTTGVNQTLNGLVMAVIANRTAGTNFKISMNYRKNDTVLENPKCVFWNNDTKKWDNDGCSVLSDTANNVSCECNHLTSFSILMSGSSTNDDPALAYITYIGVGISILSLVICIGIEATVWKSVTKNKTSYMRHVCIVNIALSLLIADIWFIIGAALSDVKNENNSIKDACVAVTYFTHFFYLSVFFWMLTMALILFYRLVYVLHDISKTIMMGISFILGYGCPLIISVVTVAVTQPSGNYRSKTVCWLNIDNKAFLAFVVPALAIVLVNFIILCVVLKKLCRPTIGDKQKKDDTNTLKHIAKCIVILTPLLGLTWGLGIALAVSNEKWIKYIFSLVNSLQGFFIFIFGCLMDKKVREALFNKFSLSRFSSQQTKSTNISSSESPFPKTVMSKSVLTLFHKKGAYNISSAQSSSPSDTPSNTYSLLN